VSGATDDRLEAVRRLLSGGSVGQARGLLQTLLAERPDWPEARLLLGQALIAAGDKVGAETAFRAALAGDPTLAEAAARLAPLLTARRASGEAVDVLRPFAASQAANLRLLTAYGEALKTSGRLGESAGAYLRAAEAAPDNGAAWHNLAGVLGDAHRFSESEAASHRALATGLDAPETWLVLGRSLVGLGRFDEAEAAFRESLRRRPGYGEAHADLAQLIWMRTEDLDQASAQLDIMLKASPLDAGLIVAKAKLIEYAVGPSAAYDALADVFEQLSADPQVQVTAALLEVWRDPAAALIHAERAVTNSGGAPPALAALCQANLAAGRAAAAAEIAEELIREWPLDQHPVTLAATAWRMLDDPRYRALYDYERLVRSYEIETPAGWPSLEAFLAELADHLKTLHVLRAHPIGQSLRHGAQTGQTLARSEAPVVRAFFAAIDAPILSYIDNLRGRDDVLGARVAAGYRFAGSWSVRLRPGGLHVNHIHPMGWISSAFHVELPAAIETGHEGWLKFGEPGAATDPTMAAEHFVKPKAGTLVLFPSYMWHGTEPFAGDEPRLSIAFDALPD
jgi:tetratricopeptide (TPR) repeat protein